MTAKTGIVVVAYESNEVIGECFDSILRHEPSSPVVVVDNAGASVPDVPSSIMMVRAQENRGYGAGCNLGVAHEALSACDFIAFLNPDVRLTGPALTEIERQMMRRPEVGAATGTIVDEAGRRKPSAWGRIGFMRVFWATANLKLEWLRRLAGRLLRGGAFTSGATMAQDELRIDGFLLGGAMVVRSQAFSDVGGFDESYFMGWEDADLGERLRRGGWELWALPTSPIVHLGSRSSAGVGAEDRRRWYDEGLTLFASRHLDRGRWTRLRVAQAVGRMLYRTRQRVGDLLAPTTLGR